MTRITSDVEALNEMFASGLVSLVGDVIRLSAILIAIFGIDWKLALFSMGSAPILFAIAAFFRRLVRDAFREIRTKMARLNAFLQEHISGIKVVQAFAQEERVARQFDEINRDYRRANARAIGADSALYSIIEAVASIAIAGLLWHGGARIAGGTLTFGVLVAFIEYLTKFFGPIRDLSAKYTIMQQAMAAAERVFGLLDTAEPDAPARVAPSSPVGGGGLGDRSSSGTTPAPLLALDRVSFGYRPGRPVLDEVTLPIRAGETIAVVGATGSGKSTLIKLLPRLYEPWSGTIRLAGTDVRDLDPAALRRRIVVVSQDVFLFAGTLGDNIGLGDPGLSREAILAAARRVGADRVIARRPEGLDAPVIERGANFSAGERQLIAFARALCRDPEILILDEATASVDPETERLIERGTEELMRGRTSIVIAHRLSTIRRATRILALHRGRVAEEGSHEELLARDGIYARLYRLQMLGGTEVAPLGGPVSGAA
jgi:ATP-binding cassette subfamily B protein